MIILKKLFLCGLALFSVACAHAQPQQEIDSMARVEFPVTWMEQMAFAYEDFKANHEDLSCFKVWAYQEDDLFYISFAPSKGVEVEGDSIKIPVAGATRCGRGMTYEFDRDGKLVRRIGIR